MLVDNHPYIYKTTDYGQSWTNISSNLPANAYIWVVREDVKNNNILYAGTEIGLFVSLTGGSSWTKLHMKNLPPVAVHDILVHSRENDLILGTHGRGIWIFDDIKPLQSLSSSIMDQPAYLFDMRPGMRYSIRLSRTDIGHKEFRGENPPYGVLITYYLEEKPEKKAKLKIEILNSNGLKIRELDDIPQNPGLNRTSWDLRMEKGTPRRDLKEEEGARRYSSLGSQVKPGEYTVRLIMDKDSYEKPVNVVMDPTLKVSLEEIERQFEFLLEIQNLQSKVNSVLRELDRLIDQIKERQKIIQGMDFSNRKTLTNALDSHLSQIEELENRMVRPPLKIWPPVDQPPRISEKLSDLFNQVDEANAAPTSSQNETFLELTDDYRKIILKVNAYLSDSAPELNSRLKKHEIPPVLIPENIPLDKDF
jgi:hypothetical protein